MLTDEMKKSVKDLVKEILSENKPAEAAAQPAPTEDIEKAKAKKSEDDDADDADDKGEKKDKKKEDKKDMKKSEGASDAKVETASQEVKTEDQGIGQLSDEEVELVKAWRASKDEPAEEISKAVEAPKQDDELKKALDSQKAENETLKKSIEAQAELIKGLTEKVEKMESQPAYDKKAVTKLEPIEKSQPETEKASKRQVIDALLTLQQEGDKDVNSHVISKYEATNQLSKSLQEKVKTQILKGK